MSIFDEKIRQRKIDDAKVFDGSFLDIAGAVMGDRLREAMEDREIAQSAFEQIITAFHLPKKQITIPSSIRTLEEQLDYQLQAYSIMCRSVKLSNGWYRNSIGVMLGTLKDSNRLVVLIPTSFSGYSIVDVQKGKTIKVNRKTENLLDEDAICLYKPLPQQSLTMPMLFKYIVSLYSVADMSKYILLSVFTVLLGLFSPIFTGFIFSEVVKSENKGILLPLTIFMVSFVICQIVITSAKNLINARIGVKEDVYVYAAIMMRLLSLPTDFFKDYTSGELTKRISYTQNLCSDIVQSILGAGLTLILSFVYVIQIYLFTPSVALPVTIFLFVVILLIFILNRFQVIVMKLHMEASGKENGMSYSIISGIQKVKLAGAEKRLFGRWADLYSKTASYLYDPPIWVKFAPAVVFFITSTATLIFYFLVFQEHYSVAKFYGFLTSFGMITASVTAFTGMLSKVSKLKPTIDLIRPILEAEPENITSKEIVTKLKGEIELDNVSFRYDEDSPYVIENLNFKINKGEYIGIVGETGSGKSTLIRLLLGFEKPHKGTISYDKKNITNLDLRSLRKNIGTVIQDEKMVIGDIYSNIVVSCPQATVEDVWKAVETASLADDIRKMPLGMSTIVSEGVLSGGQKQRLMIARAVVSDPEILIFDEATSALDNITQKKISTEIDKLNCTRIVIAHRLSTIKNCDRIIVLKDGRICEDGSYDELVSKNGLFSELVSRQRLD